MMKYTTAAAATVTLLFVASVVYAQDTEVTIINIPSTIADLSTECPAEMARISPCTGGGDVDLEACSTCVALSILENEEIINALQSQEARNNTAADACDNLQDGVCQSVEDDCAESCSSLLQQESFFTFGSDCEEIFFDLVGCVVSTQNVGQDCPIVQCTADGNAIDDENGAGGSVVSVTVASVTSMGMAAWML